MQQKSKPNENLILAQDYQNQALKFVQCSKHDEAIELFNQAVNYLIAAKNLAAPIKIEELNGYLIKIYHTIAQQYEDKALKFDQQGKNEDVIKSFTMVLLYLNKAIELVNKTQEKSGLNYEMSKVCLKLFERSENKAFKNIWLNKSLDYLAQSNQRLTEHIILVASLNLQDKLEDANTLCDKLLTIIKFNEDRKSLLYQKAQILHNIGEDLQAKGDISSSIAKNEEALKYLDQIDDQSIKEMPYEYIISILTQYCDYSKDYAKIEQLLNCAKEKITEYKSSTLQLLYIEAMYVQCTKKNFKDTLDLLNQIEHIISKDQNLNYKEYFKQQEELYANKSVILYRLKEYNELITYIEKHINLVQDKSIKIALYNNQAEAYLKLREFTKAAEAFKAYRELSGSLTKIYEEIVCLYELKNYQEALGLFREYKHDNSDESDQNQSVSTETLETILPEDSVIPQEENQIDLILPIEKNDSKESLNGNKQIDSDSILVSGNHQDYQDITLNILSYLRETSYKEKELISNKVKDLIQSKPHLKYCIKDLLKKWLNNKQIQNSFNDADSILELLDSNPKIGDNLLKNYKKNTITELKNKISNKTIKTSEELSGIHKIQTSESFKGNWFFKFSKDILKRINLTTEPIKKLINNINNLEILDKHHSGNIGIKLNEIKCKGGVKFPVLKIVGLKEDDEIYAKKLLKSHNHLEGKEYFLSIFDSIGGHKTLENIYSQHKTDGFTLQNIEFAEMSKYLYDDCDN